jgi:hypothetical protein
MGRQDRQDRTDMPLGNRESRLTQGKTPINSLYQSGTWIFIVWIVFVVVVTKIPFVLSII